MSIHIRRAGRDLACPQCGASCPGYDTRECRWRHLDTCQCKTWLFAQVQRVGCSEHGVHQLPVPWAENNSRLTALFEALVIDWLKIGTISEVSERLGLSWSAVSGVQERAVARGLPSLRTVAMDMWAPFIDSTLAHVPGAEHKIAFDKFHVAKHLGDAVDKVRRSEHKTLLATEGESVLSKSRYLWLQHPDNMTDKSWSRLEALKSANLKTARAWAIKTHAMCLWGYKSRPWARKAWMSWYAWAIRSRLEPVEKVARMIKAHLGGILTAVVTGATNARAEGFNTMIQKIKRDARGFRNKERFKAAIYFHLGGLDLYPEAVRN